MQSKKNLLSLKKRIIESPTVAVFILTTVYLIYLSFSSVMEIIHDGINYQMLGETIYQQGIDGFFKLQSSNVIGYPMIISWAMHIGSFLDIPSTQVQQWMQILFLMATQLLAWAICKKLQINKWVSALCVFYIGVSPALVNAALNTWSEIASFPFVLALVLIAVKLWRSIIEGKCKAVFGLSVLLAITFVIITLIREVYEFVTILFAAAIILASLRFLFKKKIKTFFLAVISVILLLSVHQACLYPYKMTNLKNHGYKSLVLKGGVGFCGDAIFRTQKRPLKRYLGFLATIPGENVVKKYFGMDEYNFWRYEQYDVGPRLFRDLMAEGHSRGEAEKILYRRGIESILKNPLQYTLMTTGEGFKMLFWESTKIGFVTYPSWLKRIYDVAVFKNGIRLSLFLMTFLGLIFALVYLIRNLRLLYGDDGAQEERVPILYFSLAIILSNIALHAPFIIETRYGLPIASLNLILIAFAIHCTCQRPGRSPIESS